MVGKKEKKAGLEWDRGWRPQLQGGGILRGRAGRVLP